MAAIFEQYPRRYNADGTLILDDDRSINLSLVEITNLRNLLSMMHAMPHIIPYSNGDWVAQILNKLDNTYQHPLLEIYEQSVGMPNFKINSSSILSEQTVKNIQVVVHAPMASKSNIFTERFQLITFYYYIGEHTHPIVDHEIYLCESREGIAHFKKTKNDLTPGTYQHVDYIIMRALKDEEFRQNEK